MLPTLPGVDEVHRPRPRQCTVVMILFSYYKILKKCGTRTNIAIPLRSQYHTLVICLDGTEEFGFVVYYNNAKKQGYS